MHASSQTVSDLPAPDADALAHSERLRAHIFKEIEHAGGAIPFERYMDLALYTPGLGYYSAGAQKFGAAGDFITAPEISPLFSRVVARQWAEMLQASGGDTVLELGAGSGVLAENALCELADRNALPTRYWMLETSAELRARQQARLEQALPADVFSRIQWLDALPEKPFRGVIFGNEVLDALPVARFVATEEGLCELGVTCIDDRFQVSDGGSVNPSDLAGSNSLYPLPEGEGALKSASVGGVFTWHRMPPREALSNAVAAIENERGQAFPPGYESEINLSLNGFIRSLADCLEQGAMLFIDYGLPRSAFYLEERAAGTLMCHYRHRAHDDPFFHPGLQDITAHVDFTAVAEAGDAAGLEVAGFTTQAHFLLGGGLEKILNQSDPEATRQHLELTSQVKKLTSPAEMGERFKAILLEKNTDTWLSGFELRDLTHQL